MMKDDILFLDQTTLFSNFYFRYIDFYTLLVFVTLQSKFDLKRVTINKKDDLTLCIFRYF